MKDSKMVVTRMLVLAEGLLVRGLRIPAGIR